jgi:hypothetical protein
VDSFTEIVGTFGDKYLRDVVAIRSGERWRERRLSNRQRRLSYTRNWERSGHAKPTPLTQRGSSRLGCGPA